MLTTPPAKNLLLRRGLILALLLVAVVPLALATWMLHSNLNDTLTRLVHQGLRESAERHSSKIDDFLHSQRALLNLMATSQGEALLEHTVFEQRMALLKKQTGNTFVDMGIVDPAGRQRFYSGLLALKDANYANAPWFQDFYQRKAAPYISDVFMGLRKIAHFIIVVPLHVGDEVWALRATVDFGYFSQLVENLKPGDNGEAYIINRAGVLQTHAKNHEPATLNGLYDKKQVFFKDNTTPKNINTQAHTLEDGENIFAVAPLKNTDWQLVLRLPIASAYANTREMWQIIIGSLVIMSLLMITLGITLVLRIVARFEHLSHERESLQVHLLQASKLSALGEMAAGLAHEINNPLAAIQEETGWAQDMLGELQANASTKEIATSLEKILSQIVRCKNITHEMLGFARKPDKDVNTLTSLATIIREVSAEVDQKARAAGVAIALDLHPNLPLVKTAADSLHQVFINLCNNAIDAMTASGGTLSIYAYPLPNDHAVEVRVEDTGCGMPPHVMERIFDPFFSTKEKHKGTGLGLSICYGIITGLGGDIDVSSVQGEGTTFTLTLKAV